MTTSEAERTWGSLWLTCLEGTAKEKFTLASYTCVSFAWQGSRHLFLSTGFLGAGRWRVNWGKDEIGLRKLGMIWACWDNS